MKKVLWISLGVMLLLSLCFSGACSSAGTKTTQFVIAEGGHHQSSVDPLSRADISDISVNVFDSLMCYDQNHKLTSNVCSAWKVLDSGKTIEFSLKKGIQFSSGDRLTAADVEWSFNRMMQQIPMLASQLASFDHMQVVDDYTIRFYFKEPHAIWPAESLQCLFICSKSYHDKVGEEKYVDNPVGTGPYKYAGWKMGEYTDLAINDNYYGTKPQIKNVRFDLVSDQSTQIAMLKSGEADMATDVPLQLVPALEQAGFSKAVYQMPHQVRLQFALINPNAPWSDLKVRQAIDYAIDKEGIIKSVFNGIPTPADNWLAPWEVGYDAALTPKPNYPYDLAKAKQLMSDAGYAKGFDMPLYYVTNMTGAKDVADYLTNALKQINISVTLTGGPMDPAFMDRWAKWHSDPTQLAVFLSDGGVIGNPDPLIGLNMAYISTSNFAIYANKDLDAVITKIANASDPNERATLIKQSIKILNDDLPDVPILNVVTVDMMKSNVNFAPHLYSGMGIINVKDITLK
jgi:peptide/nickel transport system substrate-binding protein